MKRRRHAYAALAVEIASAARVAWKQVAVHAERAKRYRDVIIPLRKQIMKRTQLQYNAMQVGVFQLLQAKQMEIAAQDAYISELLNYWTVKTDFAQIRSGLLVNTRSAMSKANSMPMAQEAGGH